MEIAFFFNKIYLQYVNTLTAVLDNTKIVPGQPFSCRTLAVRGGHGTTSSGYGRYSSEKLAQKKKHCSRRVRNQRRICLGRLWRYFLYLTYIYVVRWQRANTLWLFLIHDFACLLMVTD
jgi:hypothetical protein